MKSRPMIFSAPMVRAILAGQKTQTRRVVKSQPPENTSGCVQVWKGENHWDFWGFNGAEVKRVKCPYGVVGDRLWVRETYQPIYPQDPTYNNGEPIEYDYAADYKYGNRLGDRLGIKKLWKSPLFMPRAASRIELEITGIRVERVQDISEADCKAEGVEFSGIGGGMNLHQNYCWLWSKINGNQSWIDNPWVWVVEFKRVEVQS